MPTLDPLVSKDAVKARLDITDTTEDDLLNAILVSITRQILQTLNRACLLALGAAQPLVEHLSGFGTPWLWVRHWPIQAPLMPGNCTAGSAVVTGLPSTALLFAGQPVTGAAVPTPAAGAQNVTVLTINSTTQVTLSQPCTATATGSLFDFGPRAWEDDAAAWGSAPGAFAASTQLVYGVNYAVDRDQPDGSSYSGLLCRLDGVWQRSWRWPGGGGLIQPTPAAGLGNVRIQYRGGFPACPEDLAGAIVKAVARERNEKQYGQALSSESYEGYSYSINAGSGDKTGMGVLDGEIASVLARYQRPYMSGI